MVDRGACIHDDVPAHLRVGVHDRAGDHHGSGSDRDIAGNRRVRMNGASEREPKADQLVRQRAAGSVLAKAQQDVPNASGKELIQLLSTPQHGCFAELLPATIRMDIVEESDDVIVRATADDVGNHPSVSAGTPDYERYWHRGTIAYWVGPAVTAQLAWKRKNGSRGLTP